jgi:Rrf2 family cysteine metabolism transcriptional repressor
MFRGCLRTVAALKLTVKSDYATRAVLELARTYDQGLARRVDDLAQTAGVSGNYLVQILIELKSRGIVKSVRGKDGGYLLARKPEAITLGDVLRCIHGEVFDSPAITDEQCPPQLRQAWKELCSAATKVADGIDFRSLSEQGADKEEMYYI